MQRRLSWIFWAGLAACAAPEVPVPRRTGDVPYEELDRQSRILGKTRRPLGETVTIQGELVEGPFKGYEGGPNLVIQKVNGIDVQEKVQIVLHPYWDEKIVKSLVPGKFYELRGYETGTYLGVPAEAYREANVMLQTPGFYFQLSFTVISAREVAPIRR